MDGNEALEYIQSIQSNLGSDYSLKEVTELAKRFGRPERRIPVIHIAGTNGKGSVGNYISNILAQAGFTVGRYVSPTLFDYRERIQRAALHNGKIENTWITEEELADVLTGMRRVCRDMQADGFSHPTAFEVETVMAYEMFWRWRVDVSVVETGLGGRTDATNIVEKPALCVFTSISRDHMQILGDTIEEIAAEKYGIIQENTSVVSKYQPECAALLKERCRNKHAALTFVKKEDISVGKKDLQQTEFFYHGERYLLSQGGEYQPENAAIAVEAVCQLVRMQDFPVTQKQMKKALYDSHWKGRFDVVSQTPFLLVDGAHNEEAAKRLKNSLQQYFPNERFIYIVGVFRDKEYEKVLQLMLPLADRVETVTAPGSRGLPAEELAETVRKLWSRSDPGRKGEILSVSAAKTIFAALEHCMKPEEQRRIVVFGSLSILAEVYAYFEKEQ